MAEEEAIKKIDKKLDTTEDEEITVNLLYKKIDLLEDMLKQNSAELAEKSAEIEFYKKKNTELSNQLLMLYREQDNYNTRIEKKNAEIEKLKEENKKLNKSIDEINKTNYPIIN